MDARGGFDEIHNLATGSGFSEFRSAITAAGFQWAPISSFEAGNLAGASAVVLLQPYSAGAAWSQSEIAALTAFGAQNGLVMLADGGTGSSADYLNSLSSSFGVTFASSATEPLGAVITGFNPHPLTLGVSSIAVDFQRTLTISPPAFDFTQGSGASDFAAVTGRAVFVSDSSIFMDPAPFADASISSGDNRTFVENTILTVVPEPTAFVPAFLLATSAVLWKFRRNRI